MMAALFHESTLQVLLLLVPLLSITVHAFGNRDLARRQLCVSIQRPSSPLPRSLLASNNKNVPNDTTRSTTPPSALDLTTYFQPFFYEQATQLSPTRIVDMLPPEEDTPTTIGLENTTSNSKPLRQQLFTSPLISVLYERVLPPLWNAGLRIGGPDAEYQAATDFLLQGTSTTMTTTATMSPSSLQPRVLLDLSCGTGFVGLRFAINNNNNNNNNNVSSNLDHVFCLDYSPQMLGELVHSIQQQQQQQWQPASSLPISIVQGDAGHLPFADNTVDAIHWGAALHCVPNAEQALQEVYRILKPGGRLYATTFLRPFPDVVFRFFTTSELEHMGRQVGFGSTSSSSSYLNVDGRGVYGILKAMK